MKSVICYRKFQLNVAFFALWFLARIEMSTFNQQTTLTKRNIPKKFILFAGWIPIVAFPWFEFQMLTRFNSNFASSVRFLEKVRVSLWIPGLICHPFQFFNHNWFFFSFTVCLLVSLYLLSVMSRLPSSWSLRSVIKKILFHCF